jgi:hypothetical protein
LADTIRKTVAVFSLILPFFEEKQWKIRNLVPSVTFGVLQQSPQRGDFTQKAADGTE